MYIGSMCWRWSTRSLNEEKIKSHWWYWFFFYIYYLYLFTKCIWKDIIVWDSFIITLAPKKFHSLLPFSLCIIIRTSNNLFEETHRNIYEQKKPQMRKKPISDSEHISYWRRKICTYFENISFYGRIYCMYVNGFSLGKLFKKGVLKWFRNKSYWNFCEWFIAFSIKKQFLWI